LAVPQPPRTRLALASAFLVLAVVISEARGDFPNQYLALAFDTVQQATVCAVNVWALVWAWRAAPLGAVEAIVQKRGIPIVSCAGDRGSDPRSLGRRGRQLVEAA
jgi:hypothetical protein